MQTVIENYTQRVNKLHTIYDEISPRACANASGEVFEVLIDDTISSFPGLVSLRNDFLTVELNGYVMNNVQVDRHIRNSFGKVVSVIEGKTYLDSCYCKRVVVDFIEIASSSEIDENVDFVVITGQKTIDPNTYNYYQEFCRKHTGRNFKLFVLNEIKQRNSKKPLYREQFKLDNIELKRFYEYVNRLAQL